MANPEMGEVLVALLPARLVVNQKAHYPLLLYYAARSDLADWSDGSGPLNLQTKHFQDLGEIHIAARADDGRHPHLQDGR